MTEPQWIVCQIGAREHYALARSLDRRGALAALVTDLWVRPGGLFDRVARIAGRRSTGRYHAGLGVARVEHLSLAMVIDAMFRKAVPNAIGWEPTLRRNAWFQAQVVARLTKQRLLKPGTVVFAYSYAALNILRAAKAAGCVTVLGQIDPAIVEEQIVAAAVAEHPELGGKWNPTPPGYWDLWRQEVALADHVMVNSRWSRDALLRAGVAEEKLRVVPLAIESEETAAKSYPAAFDRERPLRILFLGSLYVRKGIAETFDAIRLLRGLPVRFELVGDVGVEIPADIASDPQVAIVGAVGRGAVDDFYHRADVFLIPTLSDGFALTILEAMVRGVPVVSSRRCGDVVVDGENGLLLDEISGASIAAAVRTLLDAPQVLPGMSARAITTARDFSLDHLGARLVAMVGSGTPAS